MINFNTNTGTTNSSPEFTYKDLHLDMNVGRSIGVGYNPKLSRDVLVDIDTEAIKNSLRNLFNTKPGEKVLSPKFGVNLETYLFSAITNTNAFLLGEKISQKIRTFEPRIVLKETLVRPDPDANQYQISIKVQYPNFPTDNASINLVLGLNNFTIN